MILLSASGWSPPRIATHFGCSAKPVRQVLDRFPVEGVACLRRQHPGTKPDAARREQVTTALTALLAETRTWTAGQLALALGAQDIPLSTRQAQRYLQRMAAHWRRTVRTLHHKQDPVRLATAGKTLLALKGGRQPSGSHSASSMNVGSAPVSR